MKRARQYRDRVKVERKNSDGTRDKYGNLSGDWTDLQPISEFWGNLRETTGKERVAAGRLEDAATGTLRLRSGPETRSITGADRITARGHIWAIKGAPVDPDGTRREVEFLLERGGAAE